MTAIGETVWYWPSPSDRLPQLGGNPLYAVVVGLSEEGHFNLLVADVKGTLYSRLKVPFVMPGEKPTYGISYATPKGVKL